jgi:hypothetical protein
MLEVPAGKQTMLKLRVSHHPHGDWQLRVVAAGEVLANQAVGSKTVAKDEWLNVDVDLSRFAGQKIQLSIENHPTQWHCEWAYWNRVEIISE